MEKVEQISKVAREREAYNYKWRSRSKKAAYVDLTLISIGLPAGIICSIFGIETCIADHPELKSLSDDERDRIKKSVVIIAITLLVFFSALGIWAAFKLKRATDTGRDLKDALKMARFWKNVNLIFIGLALLGMFTMQTFVTSGINLTWRAVLLYIVCQYIQELEDYLYLETTTDKHELSEPDVFQKIEKV